ncbi:MAG: beta-ketoacyl-[acyl-carrier-protein] synthase family protein [Candidatus Omnitrophica bacterium]|nr:beta-ketoacyl-[acyl-carrier-protein] synthase family protein [Candidatus Omnitrophota bacterium]
MVSDNSDESQRVVITGLGVVSAIGIGWKDFWKNLLAGKSGISEVEAFDTTPYDQCRGGEIKNFDPELYMPKRKVNLYGRASQFAITATKLCLEDAKLNLSEIDLRKAAVCIGTTMGEPQEMEYADAKILKSSSDKLHYDNQSLLRYPAANIPQNVSHFFKFRGPNFAFTTACAAGNYSLAKGMDLIKMGKANIALVGGSDSLSRMAFTGFGRLFAMAPEMCQPFDKNRRGMMLAEGSCILLLERLDSAFERKVPIYAEIVAAGFSCDARHMTNPSAESVAKAIRKSFSTAKISPNEVGYFCAHGTGTIENDRAETKAINLSWSRGASEVQVSSIKSVLGHSMGAASAIEAASCCLALKFGLIPPTMNHYTDDPECKINLVKNELSKNLIRYALNNSQAFGGNNSCILLSKDNLFKQR